MQSAKPDLTLGEMTVPRNIVLDVSQITPGKLTLLETLEMAEASGVDVGEFADIIRGPRSVQQALLMYAMAWIVARRQEPELTFAEVRTYNLQVQGSNVSDLQLEQEREKAAAIASVALLAGVSPREAEQMTVAEVSAVTSLRKARRRATPRAVVRRK